MTDASQESEAKTLYKEGFALFVKGQVDEAIGRYDHFHPGRELPVLPGGKTVQGGLYLRQVTLDGL